MRLPVDRFRRLALALTASLALSGCGMFRGDYDSLAGLEPAPQGGYYQQASMVAEQSSQTPRQYPGDAQPAAYSGTAYSSPAQAQAYASERGYTAPQPGYAFSEQASMPRPKSPAAYSPPAASPATGRATGPAADYPVVVGEPYRVGAAVYTPADTLNYDEVGYAVAEAGIGVTASHHTLPLPSYVEVTSLDTGKTLLVRVERRGPMTSDALIALSPMALNQLGANHGAPVRVRRVNPQEFDREKLRSGQAASQRMDTPETLLSVLKRKLPAGAPQQLAPALAQAPPQPLPSYPVPASQANRELPSLASAHTPAQQPAARALPRPSLPPMTSQPAPYRQPTVVASLPPQPQASYRPAPQYAPPPQQQYYPPVPQPNTAPPAQQTYRTAPAAAGGAFVVQIAALSSLQQAQRVAGAIGGHVSQTGSLYRVRMGPFTTRGQAEASLAKVHAAGYSDARIFTNG